MTTPFQPQHDQPVTMSTLNQLEPSLLADGSLVLVLRRIGKGTVVYPQFYSLRAKIVRHLQATQMELADFLKEEEEGKEPIDGETIRVLRESIEENEVTISKQQERSKMFLIAMQNQLGIDAASSHYSIAASSSGRNTVEGSRSGDRIQRNMMMGGTGGEGMEMEVESDAIANQREEEVTRGAGDELVLDPSDVNPEEEEGIYL